MVVDIASLKMAFDAEMEWFLRMYLRKPPRPLFDASPDLLEVYQRAYRFAIRRAAQFEEAESPSLVLIPPELDEMPFAETWSRGNSDGDGFGRVLRSIVLASVVKRGELPSA